MDENESRDIIKYVKCKKEKGAKKFKYGKFCSRSVLLSKQSDQELHYRRMYQ